MVIDKLIQETEEWLVFHKARGRLGMIEAMACVIRLRALREARAILRDT